MKTKFYLYIIWLLVFCFSTSASLVVGQDNNSGDDETDFEIIGTPILKVNSVNVTLDIDEVVNISLQKDQTVLISVENYVGNVKVAILNEYGVVYNTVFFSDGFAAKRIDLSVFPRATYLANVVTENKEYEELIVQKTNLFFKK